MKYKVKSWERKPNGRIFIAITCTPSWIEQLFGNKSFERKLYSDGARWYDEDSGMRLSYQMQWVDHNVCEFYGIDSEIMSVIYYYKKWDDRRIAADKIKAQIAADRRGQ